MFITIYILIFVPEKIKIQEEDIESSGQEDEDDLLILPSQVPSILKDIAKNKHTITLVVFLLATCACYSIDSNVSQVYMTNEVSQSKDKLI